MHNWNTRRKSDANLICLKSKYVTNCIHLILVVDGNKYVIKMFMFYVDILSSKTQKQIFE